MRKSKLMRAFVSVLAAGVLAVGAVACGNGNGNGDTGGDTGATTAPTSS